MTTKQICRKCLNSVSPALTLAWNKRPNTAALLQDSYSKRLHWCAADISSAQEYEGMSSHPQRFLRVPFVSIRSREYYRHVPVPRFGYRFGDVLTLNAGLTGERQVVVAEREPWWVTAYPLNEVGGYNVIADKAIHLYQDPRMTFVK